MMLAAEQGCSCLWNGFSSSDMLGIAFYVRCFGGKCRGDPSEQGQLSLASGSVKGRWALGLGA